MTMIEKIKMKNDIKLDSELVKKYTPNEVKIILDEINELIAEGTEGSLMEAQEKLKEIEDSIEFFDNDKEDNEEVISDEGEENKETPEEAFKRMRLEKEN